MGGEILTVLNLPEMARENFENSQEIVTQVQSLGLDFWSICFWFSLFFNTNLGFLDVAEC